VTEYDYDGAIEDDGVLEPADSLESDDLRSDVLDRGVDAGDGYRGVGRFGTTWAEERRGESLDQHLAEEEPEAAANDSWIDEEQPSEEAGTQGHQLGRLVAPDEGAGSREEPDLIATDAGADGALQDPEEAAVHLVDESPVRGGSR